MSNACCNECKRVHEHLASILPFKLLETVSGEPLRITGVAMAAGMSRNFNVYIPEELQAFATQLVGAPMYIEHVAVPNASGKVTKSWWDPTSRCLMYEAEVYDAETADKIRKGLIQHVSIGADYDAIDVVDGKVPHGLHNAELSLVAVPSIPETNVQVMEKLSDAKVETLQKQLTESENKLTQTTTQLTEAQKTIEDLRKQLPGGGLLKDPPKMIPVSEAVRLVESVLPSLVVQRSWRLGPQRLCQELRSVVLQLKQLAGAA